MDTVKSYKIRGGKYWEFIKEDFQETISKLNNNRYFICKCLPRLGIIEFIF
jgi:hypothetical protein